jgi:aryl-alcohol dehydrogenase-like predicted oxidoreductase
VVDYITMGRSGLKVSRACLGAMTFGYASDAPCDEAEADRMIHAFLDGGHNFIDTADIYTAGQSEVVVGRAVKNRRDAVVLATKGWNAMGPGPNDRGLSRLHLTRALEASLRRLDTDYIDLYQCHAPDADTPIEETMATLDGFVRSGKVRYLGCSNFTGSQIVEAQWAAQRVGGAPFVSLQPRYSLLARDIEADVLPACSRQGLGTLVWSPLAGGVLTGKYSRDSPPPAGTRYATLSVLTARGIAPRHFDIAEKVAEIARELRSTSTAVALAWVLGRPHVTSAIIGPRTFEQYEQNMVGFELNLPVDAVQTLNAISEAPS